MNRRPEPGEYPTEFGRYIGRVDETDILAALEQQGGETTALLGTLDEERGLFRYADGKWSIKEVIGHLIDSEHIISYRALAIARGEQASLPGFEEGDYVAAARFDAWPMRDLIDALAAVRAVSLRVLRNLPRDAWDRIGTANENRISVRALAYAMVGHQRHHLGTLRERYGL